MTHNEKSRVTLNELEENPAQMEEGVHLSTIAWTHHKAGLYETILSQIKSILDIQPTGKMILWPVQNVLPYYQCCQENSIFTVKLGGGSIIFRIILGLLSASLSNTPSLSLGL